MRPRKRAAWRGWTGIVGLATLLGAASALPVSAQDKAASSEPTRGHAILADLQEAFADVAEELEPAVVTIMTTKSASSESEGSEPFRALSPFGKNRRSTGTGSGVIIRKDGWILTNDHVVIGADKVVVRLHDGREFTGKAIRDYRSDLALVKISSPTPLPTAKLGDSDNVKIGHWAIAIGSPYRYEGSFAVGVISSLYRTQRITDFSPYPSERRYPNMIQTDAAINPGNSGGPLCNINGEVIGINTAIESEGGGSIGIGFAIPINTVKFVAQQLMEKGRVSYGFLGVSPVSVTPRLATALHVENGALLDTEPTADTPAAKAGLHAGDVVTAINKRPIHNEIDLRAIISQTPPNSSVEMVIVRNGKPQQVTATLTEAADVDHTPKSKEHPAAKPHLGIEVQPITEKLASEAGVPSSTKGVVIKALEPDSTADDSELVKGVIILKVNDRETPTVQAYQEAVANLKTGDLVKILYRNGVETHFVVVPIE